MALVESGFCGDPAKVMPFPDTNRLVTALIVPLSVMERSLSELIARLLAESLAPALTIKAGALMFRVLFGLLVVPTETFMVAAVRLATGVLNVVDAFRLIAFSAVKITCPEASKVYSPLKVIFCGRQQGVSITPLFAETDTSP